MSRVTCHVSHGTFFFFYNVEGLLSTGPTCLVSKGLERQCLIGLTVAGFNHTRIITKASAKGLDARQDDKEKCSPARAWELSQ